MKRLSMLTVSVSFVLLCIFFGVICAGAQSSVKILVDGQPVQTDVAPISVQDRIMLPARAVFEMLGATLDYEDETQTVTAVKGDATVKIVIGSTQMLVNGNAVALDVPAMILNDRTLLPVRACAEAFSAHVEWFEESSTVKISSEKYKPALVLAENGQIPEGMVLLEKLGDDRYAKQLLRRFIVQPKTITKTFKDAVQGRILSNTTERVEPDEKGNIFYSTAVGNIYKGITYKFTYDAYGRIVERYGESRMDDGVICTENSLFTYEGERIVKNYWNSNASGSNTTCYTYDQNGNLIKSTLDGPYLIDFYDNDAFGNCIKLERWSGYPDASGNLLAEEFLYKKTFAHEYDAFGNRIKTVFYDENGVAEKEQTLTYQNGKLVAVEEATINQKNTEENTLQLKYDENGICVQAKVLNFSLAGGGGSMYSTTYNYSDFAFFYFPHVPETTSDELSLHGAFQLAPPYKIQ